jgi:hypothetical protein
MKKIKSLFAILSVFTAFTFFSGFHPSENSPYDVNVALQEKVESLHDKAVIS